MVHCSTQSTKHNQEATLAIRPQRTAFEANLEQTVHWHFAPTVYGGEIEWRKDLAWAEAFTPLSEAERKQLLLAPELGNYVCRLCGDCLPCPEGLNIPRIFTLEGWYDRQMWDGVVRDPGDYWLRQTLRFWFMNEERARTAYGALDVRADACTQCGECEPRCPYDLCMIDKLEHAHYKLTVEPK